MYDCKSVPCAIRDEAVLSATQLLSMPKGVRNVSSLVVLWQSQRRLYSLKSNFLDHEE